jgi:hypothetical protein
MTVVTIWLEPGDSALWAIADTRISSPGTDGGITISTDSAAKLFAIPVQCNRPSTRVQTQLSQYATRAAR